MSLHTLQQAAGFLRASQLGVDLTGRNIAGADEEGYTRQRIEQSALHVDYNGGATPEAGMGVRVDGFNRVRDGFLDAAYRSHNADVGAGRAVEPLLSRLEEGFGRVDLSTGATEVRIAFSNAANSPEESGLANEALIRLGGLTSDIKTLSHELVELEGESIDRHEAAVERFNGVLSELAELNTELPLGKKTGAHNALLDSRDKLLDELSGMAEVRIKTDSQNRAAVYLDGREILFTNRAETLSLDADGNLLDERGREVDAGSGELEGHRSFRQGTLATKSAQIDQLAVDLVNEMNTIHRSGYASDGVSGRDLLSGTNGADLEVVISDPAQLALATSRMESADRLGGTDNIVSDIALNGQPFQTAPSANGVININGTDVAWDDTQSLDTINENLSAAGVEAVWNPVSQRLLLSRLPDGNPPADITVSDTSGNLSQTLALTNPSYPGQDGSVAQRMSDALGEDRFSGDSFEGLADFLLTEVGSEVRQVQDETRRAERLADGALSRREQVSGVSVDEELLNLNRYQQSFAAAARLANTADEMLATVIGMGA